MKITRDVIIDLLPLYLANEASEESRKLIEQFLADDPALAKLVEQSDHESWRNDVPVPLKKEDEMKSFEKTKQILFQQKLFLALAVGMTLLLVAFRFDEKEVEWLWINSPAAGWAIFVAATVFWIAFLNVAYLLNKR